MKSRYIFSGFSSVVYGANTMAGVIDLISKKPTKEFEGDINFEFNLDNHTKYFKISRIWKRVFCKFKM